MFLNKILRNIKKISEIGLFEWLYLKYDIYKSNEGERIGYIRDEYIKAKEQKIDLRDFYISKFESDELYFIDIICDTINSFVSDDFYVVEIGSGCGLITHPLLNKEKDFKKYDSYEPDRSLRRYLLKTFAKYKTFSNFKGDGSKLVCTEDKKADLVFAFGVFTLIPIATIVSYIEESNRILKNNGILAFDIFDTDCLSEKLINKFILQASRNDSRPFLSRRFIIKYMNHQGFELDKELRHANEYRLFLFFRKVNKNN